MAILAVGAGAAPRAVERRPDDGAEDDQDENAQDDDDSAQNLYGQRILRVGKRKSRAVTQKDNDTLKRVTVSADQAGARLDRVLANVLDGMSRSRLKQLIEGGHVRRGNDLVSSPSAKVAAGEAYEVTIPAPVDPVPVGQAIPLEILYEDDSLIVIDKPSGMVVHPGPGQPDGTLVNALIHHCGDTLSGIGGVKRPGIVHRLDKDTSGLMMIARTELAHRVLVAALGARDVHRRYLALVQGVPTAGGKIDEPIGRHARHRTKMAVVSGGRDAVTHYTVRRRYTRFALLDVRLETGRTHQIRVHLAHIGYPIAGDPTYGGRARPPAGLAPIVAERLRQIGRQALHACELSFVHPATEERMTFTADPPVDMTQLIVALENYDQC